jgi:preprotein translocase subunit SecE
MTPTPVPIPAPVDLDSWIMNNPALTCLLSGIFFTLVGVVLGMFTQDMRAWVQNTVASFSVSRTTRLINKIQSELKRVETFASSPETLNTHLLVGIHLTVMGIMLMAFATIIFGLWGWAFSEVDGGLRTILVLSLLFLYLMLFYRGIRMRDLVSNVRSIEEYRKEQHARLAKLRSTIPEDLRNG